jgi:hypothetical protein
MGKRHSPEQIVRKLRQAEARLAAGASVPEAARDLGISEATFQTDSLTLRRMAVARMTGNVPSNGR